MVHPVIETKCREIGGNRQIPSLLARLAHGVRLEAGMAQQFLGNVEFAGVIALQQIGKGKIGGAQRQGVIPVSDGVGEKIEKRLHLRHSGIFFRAGTACFVIDTRAAPFCFIKGHLFATT